MADGHRRAGQRVDDGALAAAAGHHAQKRTLIAREQKGQRRAAWWQEQARIDPRRLLFLDETSTPTTMTPAWGRSRRGERVIGRVPRGRLQAVTLVATLTPAGFGPGLQLEGAIDRPAFDACVIHTLVPTLRPGDVVVLGTLSVHKSARARQAVEAAGARLLFLPAYSPDFNPIEQAFSKLKHHLRTVHARTLETVMAATQAGYGQITASDARGYYRHAGYNLRSPL